MSQARRHSNSYDSSSEYDSDRSYFGPAIRRLVQPLDDALDIFEEDVVRSIQRYFAAWDSDSEDDMLSPRDIASGRRKSKSSREREETPEEREARREERRRKRIERD